MSAILNMMISYVCKALPIKQLVASCLMKALNKVLANKSPATIEEYIATAECVFEAAAAMKTVADSLQTALADGKIDQVEADAIVTATQSAFTNWAAGKSTPQAFKDTLRVVSDVVNPVTTPAA